MSKPKTRKYHIGSIFETKKWGKVEIIDYVHYTKVLIRFLDSGYEYWTTTSLIAKGSVKDHSRVRIFGVGIVDVGYKVEGTKDGKRFICPYFRIWRCMLQRCYYKPVPSYVDCYVDERWHRLSVFKAWMETQDWEGKQLDKDLLFLGNKVYSPETCVFISGKLNTFIMSKYKEIGELPRGYGKVGNRYGARSSRGHIGSFLTAEEAHAAWKAWKLEAVQELLEDVQDERILDAIKKRYS